MEEFNKQNPEIPCNIWKLVKNMLVDMTVMSAEINSLKERVYTLEGLIK